MAYVACSALSTCSRVDRRQDLWISAGMSGTVLPASSMCLYCLLLDGQ